MQDKLRIHHLLCIPLFRGAGYDEKFSRNMTEKIKWLKEHSAQQLKLVCSADMICEKCPNLTAAGNCRSDNNQVQEKDRQLCDRLGIKADQSYTYGELQHLMGRKMTRFLFEQSCISCEWYGKGFCSWEGWQEEMAYVSSKVQ